MTKSFSTEAGHQDLADFCRTIRPFEEFAKHTKSINEGCPFCKIPFKPRDKVQGILVETRSGISGNGQPEILALMLAAHPLCAQSPPSEHVH